MLRVIGLILTSLICASYALPPVDRTWSSRVVGGEDAAPGEAAYMIQLLMNNRFNCAGSIIDKRVILTAAHCTGPEQSLTVVAGTNYLSTGGVRYGVAKVINHEGYGNNTIYSNDIALLILDREIVYGENIKPIKLGTEVVEGSAISVLFGWGRTSVSNPPSEALQKLTLHTLSNSACEDFWGSMIRSYSLCTLTKAGEGACFGDSGGPLVSLDGFLIGIVSWGNPCANGRPDVFARVSSYIDWVAENTVY